MSALATVGAATTGSCVLIRGPGGWGFSAVGGVKESELDEFGILEVLRLNVLALGTVTFSGYPFTGVDFENISLLGLIFNGFKRGNELFGDTVFFFCASSARGCWVDGAGRFSGRLDCELSDKIGRAHV